MADKSAVSRPPAVGRSLQGDGRSYTTVLLVNNIHCSSCVAYVKEVLSDVSSIENVDVSILTQEVRVRHGPTTGASELATVLIHAAFEVHHAATYDSAGSTVADIDTSFWLSSRNSGFPSTCGLPSSPSPARLEQRAGGGYRAMHIEKCDACREELEKSTPTWRQPDNRDEKGLYGGPEPLTHCQPGSDNKGNLSDAEEHLVPVPSAGSGVGVRQLEPDLSKSRSVESVPVARHAEPEQFDARISIEGMTCASCVNTITNEVQSLDYVKAISVNLLTNSATLTFLGPKENIDRIIDHIEDIGYGASLDEINAKSPSPQEEFDGRISITGMTCASCVNTITNELQQLECVKSVTVNLLANSATLIYSAPKSNIDKVINLIEDIGYEASVDEVSPRSTSRRAPTGYVAEISISGMTCASCVGAITRGVQELPFTRDVAVDLLSNSGRIEFEGRDNLDKIIEKIEDLGYDAAVITCSPLAADRDDPHDAVVSRTVMIRVEGMFCHHCPEKVLESLHTLSDASFVIQQRPSLKDPILKITYTPRQPSLTIRNILSAIERANAAFKPSIHHPPSIEDRSRAMQWHERRRLLSRLLFVLAVAIPTFIIGIVFMSLVSPKNRIRMYLEAPIWAGRVSRIEWALFIMTTPVMFYGADVFHIRTVKEIRALWRPGSRVAVLRRFYRFGSMNFLISAGTMVAYIASLAVLIIDAAAKTPTGTHTATYFDSVVFLTLFILAGRFLEAYSKAKAGDAVGSLRKLRPSEALLVVDPAAGIGTGPEGSAGNRVQRVSVDLLEVGDTVNIPHGASPPADGIVTGNGSYQFDESSLTGESRPVKKSAGDKVYTGSVNVGQPVSIVITELAGSSMLDQIVAVVREGQAKRAPLERFADLLTAYFVPVITLIAIVTFVVWLTLGETGVLPADYLDVPHGGWTFWSLEFAVAVFVVACPCGLALAAPTALFVGSGLAAKHGILVRGGGEAFQEASRLDAIVFDKTGTLTEGDSLKVSDHEVLVNDPESQDVAWALARELEESSNHPIARAISQFCRAKPTPVSVISSDINEISGQGMKGTFTLSISGSRDEEKGTQAKYEAAIGNERLLQSLVSSDVDTYYLSNLLSRYQSGGKSTAILSIRKLSDTFPETSRFAPVIVFATSDPIRAEAVDVISQLQKRHVSVFMCTGDNQTTAHAVAAVLGIPRSNVMANVLPNQKAEFIRRVQEGPEQLENPELQAQSKEEQPKRRIVAFVGDGTNDSPALAAADVSIAMASGSDVAINSASFILLNSDLTTILELVNLSRRVFRRVEMNFFWAAVYNLCLVPIAAGVLYPIVTGKKHIMTGGGEMVTVDKHWRLSPVWAALAMALSSVSVVSSSLALNVEWRSIKGFFEKRSAQSVVLLTG